MKVVVTGASGFIGRALIASLAENGHQVTATVRSEEKSAIKGAHRTVALGDIDGQTDWSGALAGHDVVVHLAARVHQGEEPEDETTWKAHQAVTVKGTANLARQAAAAGVKRFIFASSVKAVAEKSGEARLDESTPEKPQTAYGQAKLAAEKELATIATSTGLETVILRLPLVYGPGVGANMAALIRQIRSGRPLPLGAIGNQRSFLYTGNLCFAFNAALNAPGLAGKTFFVADGPPLSTPEMIEKIATALGVDAPLIPVPLFLLKILGWAGDLVRVVTGWRPPVDSGVIQRLTESLAVDFAPLWEAIGNGPPYSIEQGMRDMVESE